VVGIYFPACLQGFSILAARETMAPYPEGFALSGALDISVAIAMYPEVLARDWNTPTLDCAANIWSSDSSLCFDADDHRLDFLSTGVQEADGTSSSGLLFLG